MSMKANVQQAWTRANTYEMLNCAVGDFPCSSPGRWGCLIARAYASVSIAWGCPTAVSGGLYGGSQHTAFIASRAF